MESDAAAVSHESTPGERVIEAAPQEPVEAGNALANVADADEKFVTDTALLVTQGKHRFYSLVLPSDVLAATCTVDPRQENPIDGFQRLLDKRRATSPTTSTAASARRPARSFSPPSRARNCIMIAPASCCGSVTARTRF